MASIKLNNIIVRNEQKVRLQIDRLAIQSEERIGIIGDIGAGKSTLLLLLSQLIQPNSGTIQVSLDWVSSYVMQQPEQSFFESNVADEIGNIDNELFDLLHLDFHRLASRDPFSLSGGEARRVALARSLLTNSSYLLWDEPTSGLDYEGVQSLIKILSQRELGYVIAAHDLDFLVETCTRWIALEHGKVVWDDSKMNKMLDEKCLNQVKHELPLVSKIWMSSKSMLGESTPSTMQELKLKVDTN